MNKALNEFFNDFADNRDAAEALERFLKAYLTPSFGALPKREIDLEVLGVLIDIGYLSGEPTIYELISKLAVTRSKARSLLYDRELRRLDEDALDIRIKDALRNPRVALSQS